MIFLVAGAKILAPGNTGTQKYCENSRCAPTTVLPAGRPVSRTVTAGWMLLSMAEIKYQYQLYTLPSSSLLQNVHVLFLRDEFTTCKSLLLHRLRADAQSVCTVTPNAVTIGQRYPVQAQMLCRLIEISWTTASYPFAKRKPMPILPRRVSQFLRTRELEPPM
jgi:hypothetical protein